MQKDSIVSIGRSYLQKEPIMKRSIDARDLPCPKPVVLTKQVLDEGDFSSLEVLVDTIAAKENVIRMLSRYGYTDVLSEETSYGFILSVGKKESSIELEKLQKEKTILFSSQYLGDGEDTLGALLMKGFIYTLTELASPPTSLIFMNSSIFLTLEGTDTLQDLKRLEESGVEIQVCGTCLDFYKEKDHLGVGSISNMYSIIERLMDSEVLNIS